MCKVFLDYFHLVQAEAERTAVLLAGVSLKTSQASWSTGITINAACAMTKFPWRLIGANALHKLNMMM